jgi:1-acyl-sn-glycerol-3-phosphate acyltransferase
MLPPKVVRRIVLAPFAVLLSLSLVVLFPLLGLALALLGLANARGFHAFRLLCFAVIWLMAETTALFMCLGLWIASGFGGRRLRSEAYRRRHYAVMRWFLDVLYRGAERTFGLRVVVSEPDADAAELAARLTRPVIVLSRHAGPGDSFLLVHQLLSVYDRRPRVVMKAAIQLDPGVDVVGNRLPNVFVRHRQAGEGLFTSQVARLAADLGDDDALVIFPEGGNWTPGRWRRGIRRLETAGRPDLAGRARRMPNLLPPRAGGTLAAIAACPAADVIFVAHAGLDRLVSARDVWRYLPERQTLVARWWRVPSESVPRSASHEEQERWLYDWWERIDAWITENRPAAETAPAQ